MTKLVINIEKSTSNLVKKKVPVKGKDGKVHMAFRYVNPNKDTGAELVSNVEDTESETENTTPEVEKPTSLFDSENPSEVGEKVESQTQKEVRDVVSKVIEDSDTKEKTPSEAEAPLNNDFEGLDPIMHNYNSVSEYLNNTGHEGRYEHSEEFDNLDVSNLTTEGFLMDYDNILDTVNHYSIPPQLSSALASLSKMRKAVPRTDNSFEFENSIRYNSYQVLKAFGDNFKATRDAIVDTMGNTFGKHTNKPVYEMNEKEWSNKIKSQCFDVQLGEATTDDKLKLFNVLGSHPGICSFAVDTILGGQKARELRNVMRNGCVSITMPSSVMNSVLDSGYHIKSSSDFIADNILANEDIDFDDYKRYKKGDTSGISEDNIQTMEKVSKFIEDVAEEEYFSLIGSSKQNGIKLYEELEEKASEHDFTLDSYSAQTRYEAERDTSGIYFSDYKPCYMFFNPTGSSEGLELYGDSTTRVSNKVLSQCTCVSDDSFVNTSTVPSVYGINHLKDLYLLKNIMSHPERIHDGSWSEINNKDYEIPLELQYHSKTEQVAPELLSPL